MTYSPEFHKKCADNALVLIPEILAALAEFPDDESLRHWLKMASVNDGIGAYNIRPANIHRMLDNLRTLRALRDGAENTLAAINAWNDPEPPRPTWKCPDCGTTVPVSGERRQYIAQWEGDGMRGRDDDSVRTAVVDSIIYSADVEAVYAVCKDWPVEPVISTYRVDSYHGPVEILSELPAYYFISNFSEVSDVWYADNHPAVVWDRLRDIQSLAKIVDGYCCVPVGDEDGGLQLARLSEGNWRDTVNLVDWESWESFNKR